MAPVQLIFVNALVSATIVYYMIRKTGLRRRAARYRAAERKEHLAELLQSVRNKNKQL